MHTSPILRAATLAGLLMIPASAEVIPGATENTPSLSQYFSWINNTNEGSTEAQTLANLAFFKWLHDEYGMKLDIYAFDAGAIDGPETYGSTETDKFKAQFPRGFQPIYEYAKSFDCRLGVWLGPDGFGDTPEEEQKRIDMLVGFCRDYDFALFKMDAVCTQLRPEKRDAFARLMTECRKHSPDLILLNHRLDLGDAVEHATTFLWGGEETYIDVHMVNKDSTGTHNRVQAISRGMVPDLKRLTEDHGVCISSCLDFWEDDLILQAFNRNLILAPEIYANPWFLRDDEFPRLARIYNLHRRYRDIMVNGMVLDEKRYGPLSASRGDGKTRLITLRNLTWEPVTYKVKLDASIGLDTTSAVSLRRLHPGEEILGRFGYGEEVAVEVAPFRSCLLLASSAEIEEVGLKGSDYELVRDVPGKDVIINILGGAGEKPSISLAGGRKFSKATLDGEPVPDLVAGKTLEVSFPGKPDRDAWHRKVGSPKEVETPTDAEELYETGCFAADNDPLEFRSLRRSGPTQVPQVQAARDFFVNQPIIAERGILQGYLFDGKAETVYDLLRMREREPESRYLRIDLGKAQPLDQILLEAPAAGEILHAEITEARRAEVSADLKTWSPAKLVQDGRNIRIECAGDVRYIRTNLVPSKLAEIRGVKDGKELDRTGWSMSYLFPAFREVQKSWSLPFVLEKTPKTGYLAVACNGEHGREGVWAALKVDGKIIGPADRAPSFPVNPWEYPVRKTEGNYTFFFPLTPDMAGKKCEVVVLAFDPTKTAFTPEVWQTVSATPWETRTLILSK